MEIMSSKDMFALFSNIQFINLRATLGGYIALVGGLLVSLWTHCILVAICIQPYGTYYGFQHGTMYLERLAIVCGQITYFVVVVAGYVGLAYGIKHKDKMFVYPWMWTKIFETVLSLIGTILLATYGRYMALMSVSLICLLAAGFLSLCAWHTAKMLGERPEPPSEETVPMPTDMNDKPPSYAHFTNQV